MLIVYVDNDSATHERLTEHFRGKHLLLPFRELYEAYKWIKHNEIPDMIVTEIDVEDSTGLQSLRFLLSKAKLKRTLVVGYTRDPSPYSDLIKSEGAAALLAKENLSDELSTYIKRITGESRKGKTLRDVENTRVKKAAVKPQRKRAVR